MSTYKYTFEDNGVLLQLYFQIRSKKENAEKIWAEMQRRKSQKERPTKSSRKKKKRSLSQSSRKDMTGKQKKRLSALEELMDDGEPEPVAVQQNVEEENVDDTSEVMEESKAKGDGSGDGIFGKIKGFYEKADSMAASQALMLNKELEDRGVIEKITDESGLKVVGKEKAAEAAKMKNDADAGEEK